MTTKPGPSFTSTGRLRSLSATAHVVASETSSVSGVRTSSTSGIAATGLKKCIPTSAFRMPEPVGHRGHRQSRCVRRQDALGRDNRLELSEQPPLDAKLLEDGLEHEVAVLEAVIGGRALRERRERDRFLGIEAAARGRGRQVVADRLERAVDDLLLQVAEDDRNTEPPEEERRELGRHQACACDPHLLHVARLGRGTSGTASCPPLDEVERVEGRLRLRREEQVGERLLLGPVALLEAPARSAFDQVESSVGSGGRAVHHVVELPPRARDDLGGPGQVRVLPREPVRGDRDRLLDEPLRLDDTVDKAELERLLRGEHLVLPQWVEDGELDGGLRPREPRRELGRSPGGDESEEALGRCEVADVVGDHAVVAVQRELDSAAEGRPH